MLPDSLEISIICLPIATTVFNVIFHSLQTDASSVMQCRHTDYDERSELISDVPNSKDLSYNHC